MNFVFDARQLDSPLVEMVWRTQSEQAGIFTSVAESRSEIVVTRCEGKTSVTVRGPETRAGSVPCPADAEFFGIVFRLGTFMPCLPAKKLRDRQDVTLPGAANKSFWLYGDTWEVPDYENVETFVERLVHDDLLVHDPIVDAVLQNRPQEISLRSVQRRFLQATGLTHGLVNQIKRARQAAMLLEQGTPILDTVELGGYSDQPHLTRSLKRFIGQTPAQLLRSERLE